MTKLHYIIGIGLIATFLLVAYISKPTKIIEEEASISSLEEVDKLFESDPDAFKAASGIPVSEYVENVDSPTLFTVEDFQSADAGAQDWITYSDLIANGTSECSISTDESAENKVGKLECNLTNVFPYPFGGAQIKPEKLKSFNELNTLKGVRFKAKGSDAIILLQVLTSEVSDNNDFGKGLILNPEWHQYEVPFESLKQQPWGAKKTWKKEKITGVGFHFSAVAGSYEVLFDDVEFY